MAIWMNLVLGLRMERARVSEARQRHSTSGEDQDGQQQHGRDRQAAGEQHLEQQQQDARHQGEGQEVEEDDGEFAGQVVAAGEGAREVQGKGLELQVAGDQVGAAEDAEDDQHEGEEAVGVERLEKLGVALEQAHELAEDLQLGLGRGVDRGQENEEARGAQGEDELGVFFLEHGADAVAGDGQPVVAGGAQLARPSGGSLSP